MQQTANPNPATNANRENRATFGRVRAAAAPHKRRHKRRHNRQHNGRHGASQPRAPLTAQPAAGRAPAPAARNFSSVNTPRFAGTMSHNRTVEGKPKRRQSAGPGSNQRTSGTPRPATAPRSSLTAPAAAAASEQINSAGPVWFNSSTQPAAANSGPWLRRSESVLIGYFLYAAVMSAVLPVPSAVTSFTLGLNLTLIGLFLALAYASRMRPHPAIEAARDWLPLAVLLLAYREMGWFAPSHHVVALENGWILWDRRVLGDWGIQTAIETLGPLLPSLLEICYSLVYAIGPLCLAALYLWGRRDRADAFLFRFLLGTVLSYALFPYFPSEPPRVVFPADHLPAFDTIFRQFNWWLLGNHGIHTSVFPSAHVSSAYAGAFALLRVMPERRWAGWALTLLATGIFWATIYGRYHYVVDAAAGLAIAVAAFLLCEWIDRRWPSSTVSRRVRAADLPPV